MNIGIGLLIPFLGTVLGAAMVFFMKNTINKKIEKLLLGFAAGVMISASIWSLLLPSLEMVEEQNGISWLPATIGFMLGIIFLLILDSIIPHLHLNNKEPEGIKTKLKDFAIIYEAGIKDIESVNEELIINKNGTLEYNYNLTEPSSNTITSKFTIEDYMIKLDDHDLKFYLKDDFICKEFTCETIYIKSSGKTCN